MLQAKFALITIFLLFNHLTYASSDQIIPGFSKNNSWITKQFESINSRLQHDFENKPISYFFNKHETKYSIWNNHLKNKYISYKLDQPYTVSKNTTLSFLIHSATKSNSTINFLLKTENKNIYLRNQIKLDWKGWKLFSLNTSNFIGNPKSIDINNISFIAEGWNSKPSNLSSIIVSDIHLNENNTKNLTKYDYKKENNKFKYIHKISLKQNSYSKDINLLKPIHPDIGIDIKVNNTTKPKDNSITFEVETTLSNKIPPLETVPIGLVFEDKDKIVSTQTLFLVTPPSNLPIKTTTIISDEDIEAIINLGNKNNWIKKSMNNIIKHADNIDKYFLEKYGMANLTPPKAGGEWGMNYLSEEGHKYTINPDTFDEYSWEHCTKNNTCIHNDYYDKIIYGKIHNDLAMNSFYLGLAYKLTNNDKYANKCKSIIENYIKWYPKYKIHSINKKHDYIAARTHSQNFEEARWLIYMILGFNMINEQTYISKNISKQFEEKIIRPSIQLLDSSGAPNQKAWNISAKTIAGFMLQDPIIIKNSIYDKNGFKSLINNNTTTNGSWKEDSWAYYFYAIEPILYITESSYRNSINLYNEKLNKLLLSPLSHIKPNGKLPSFGDTRNEIDPSYYSYIFRLASKRFKHTKINFNEQLKHNTLLSLLWTYDVNNVSNIKKTHSTNNTKDLNKTDIAVLKTNGKNEKYIALKLNSLYAHSHYDNLSIIYSMGKYDYLIDPGTINYGHKLSNEFYKQSIAHNTIAIDEKSHTKSKTNLSTYINTPNVGIVQAFSNKSYENNLLSRSIILTDKYFIDIFSTHNLNGNNLQIDYSLHADKIDTLNLNLTKGEKHWKRLNKHYRDTKKTTINNSWNYIITPENKSKSVTPPLPLLATTRGFVENEILLSNYINPKGSNTSSITARRFTDETSFTSLFQHINTKKNYKKYTFNKSKISNTKTLIEVKGNNFIDSHIISKPETKNPEYTYTRTDYNGNELLALLANTKSIELKNIKVHTHTYKEYVQLDFNKLDKSIYISTPNPSNLKLTIEFNGTIKYHSIYINNTKVKSKKVGNKIII